MSNTKMTTLQERLSQRAGNAPQRAGNAPQRTFTQHMQESQSPPISNLSDRLQNRQTATNRIRRPIEDAGEVEEPVVPVSNLSNRLQNRQTATNCIRRPIEDAEEVEEPVVPVSNLSNRLQNRQANTNCIRRPIEDAEEVKVEVEEPVVPVGNLSNRLQNRQANINDVSARLHNRQDIEVPIQEEVVPVLSQEDAENNLLNRIANRTRATAPVERMIHNLETGQETYIRPPSEHDDESEDFVSGDEDSDEELEEAETFHSDTTYHMNGAFDSAPKMSEKGKRDFLTSQCSKTGFDPISTINEVRNAESLALERRRAMINALLPKKHKDKNLDVEAIKLKQKLTATEKDYVKEYEKAEKKCLKNSKVSASAQRIKDTNIAKSTAKRDDKDAVAIEQLESKWKHITSLKMIGNVTSKLSSSENVIIALSKLFLKFENGDLKKHMFIELVERMNDDATQLMPLDQISDVRLRNAMQVYSANFTRAQQVTFCFEHRRNVMAPFSPLTKPKYSPESFQMEAVDAIVEGKSVLISAPTSAGKTVVSQYCTSLEGKTLMIQPTQELVDQCAATMIARDTKVFHINSEQLLVPKEWKIMIGTPESIWRFLMISNAECVPKNMSNLQEMQDNIDEIVDNNGKPDNSNYCTSHTFDWNVFKYVVIDEIQQMNVDEYGNTGNQARTMQQLVMYFVSKQLILLSATVQNIDEIVSWLRYLKNDVGTDPTVVDIRYTKRFINQEMRVYTNGEPTVVSPLSAITFDFIAEGRLLTTEMQIPPRQLPEMSRSIIAMRPASATAIDINVFFADKPVTITNCKEYEDTIKNHLTLLSTADPEVLRNILANYAMTPINIEKLSTPELFKILMHHKENNLLICLAFIFNTQVCRKTAYNLLEYMESEEKRLYPLWEDMVKIQNQHYTNMMNSTLKAGKVSTGKGGKTNDNGDSAKILAEERSEFTADSALNNYKNAVMKLIDHHLGKWEVELAVLRKYEDSDPLLIETLVQRIVYYKKELYKIQYITSLTSINQYAPHPSLTFAKDMIDDNMLREIKHLINPPKVKTRRGKIKEVKRGELELIVNIGYRDAFMRCVERGFMFYTQDLKDLNGRFQGITQTVLDKCGVQVIFSDASYAYGINLPVRSVLFYNPDYNGKLDYLEEIMMVQGGGRAGRRGLDTEGNITCAGINHGCIHRREYRNIKGVDVINPGISIPLIFNTKYNISALCKAPLLSFGNSTVEELAVIEADNRRRIINDFTELSQEAYMYSPMHIYRLMEVTPYAINMQKLCVSLTEKSWSGLKLHDYELIEIFSSLHFVNDLDSDAFSASKVTDLITEITPIYGYKFNVSKSCKGNAILTDVGGTLSDAKVIKEIMRVLISNNQNITADWMLKSKAAYKNLNKLLFKFTV